jgi:hypothetical protein
VIWGETPMPHFMVLSQNSSEEPVDNYETLSRAEIGTFRSISPESYYYYCNLLGAPFINP